MSWLYVPGLAGSPSDSEKRFPRFEPSATWRGKPMRPQSWSGRCKRNGWIELLSGLTCEPSTLAFGVEAWISSLRASRASLTASQGSVEAMKTTGGSSTTSHASFAKRDHATSSWRMCPGLYPQGSIEFSARWPASGTMRNGACSARPKSERTTSGSGCSSLLPTPAARDHRSGKGRKPNGHTPQLPEVMGGLLNPQWIEEIMHYPIGWTDCAP